MIPSWDIKEYGVEPLLSVDEVCRVSDYVSPHVFLNDSTYHMFSDRQFEANEVDGVHDQLLPRPGSR